LSRDDGYKNKTSATKTSTTDGHVSWIPEPFLFSSKSWEYIWYRQQTLLDAVLVYTDLNNSRRLCLATCVENVYGVLRFYRSEDVQQQTADIYSDGETCIQRNHVVMFVWPLFGSLPRSQWKKNTVHWRLECLVLYGSYL